jgi:hypothetical protein
MDIKSDDKEYETTLEERGKTVKSFRDLVDKMCSKQIESNSRSKEEIIRDKNRLIHCTQKQISSQLNSRKRLEFSFSEKKLKFKEKKNTFLKDFTTIQTDDKTFLKRKHKERSLLFTYRTTDF